MTDLSNTSAAAEFTEAPAPVAPPESATDTLLRADNERMAAALTEATEQIGVLKGKAEIADKLKSVFAGPADDLSPKDKTIRDELTRIAPELDKVGKHEQALQAIATALEAQSRAVARERVNGAQELTRDLMTKSGLDGKDDEAYGLVEHSVAAAIKSDPKLAALWEAGNYKQAVSRGFEKVSAKILAPARAGAKRSAVSALDGLPRSVRGDAPVAGKSAASDASARPASLREAHDLAWTKMQELHDR